MATSIRDADFDSTPSLPSLLEIDNTPLPQRPSPFASACAPACASASTSTTPSSSHQNQTMRRQRKKPRVFEPLPSPFARKFNKGALGLSGPGVKLSHIPNITYSLDKLQPKDTILELLHRILFNSQGVTIKRKQNIRSFSGFVLNRTEIEKSRSRDKLFRVHYNIVRRLANILDVHLPHVERTVVKPDDDVERTVVKPDEDAEPTVVKPDEDDDGDDDDGDGDVNSGGSQYAALRIEQRLMKEVAINAILNFLQSPRLAPGRPSLALRDKEIRAQRRAHDRSQRISTQTQEGEQGKDKNKLTRKKRKSSVSSTTKKNKLTATSSSTSSTPDDNNSSDDDGKMKNKKRGRIENEEDEDGDEDLETEALPWIDLVQQDHRILCALSAGNIGHTE